MSRILVVDDEETVRKTVRRILERAGYQVTEAEDGAEALETCQHELPDLVITDIVMPGKAGIETIEELRKQYPDLGIIAISGGGINPAEAYLPLAKQVGAQHTLSKPFAVQELLDAVQALLPPRQT